MQHGGSTNAFTSSEQTNYHFEVNTDGFEEALDRYILLFIVSSLIPNKSSSSV